MITNEDLLKEISQRELTELSDLNGTGELNQEIIDDAVNDAISFIESFITLPDNPTPLLKKILTELTIMELRKKNELNPDKERLKEIENYLLKMAANKIPSTLTEQQNFERTTSQSFVISKKRVSTKGFL
ncbi:phage protein Gp36 family protein [Hydrogenimonas thermophila]|uniref:phage protein Gp36 family protein n=1 Tax=Hydrogenimonas thermophila TaxID=223786 RepID=UPI002936F7F7|nr:phage protein Gp36 family protein [Hydrogenimonas thermophila]WOE69099.1 phage protein Gp36 family protein [Hydrogenimonas thermophila]WOE71609.1 phage protein Gp36 family protein [Hydrogenimonas thermophila]